MVKGNCFIIYVSDLLKLFKWLKILFCGILINHCLTFLLTLTLDTNNVLRMSCVIYENYFINFVSILFRLGTFQKKRHQL